MKIADAYVEISARGKGGSDGTAEARAMGKSMAKSVGDEFTRTIVDLGLGRLAFTGFRRAIDAGSGLNETMSKTRAVFGEGSKAVEAFGDSAAQSLGQSKQQAMEAAATYGNLFQAFGIGQVEAQKMSTSLVQLATDLASFNNTSVDDAIEALRSGLTGETEPLKRYGVALSDVRLKQEALAQGIITSTSQALDPAQKAQAAYALVMKDTALAQGDFARTADGAANSAKIAAAELKNAEAAVGQNLIPTYTKAVQIVGDLAQVFASLPGPVQTAVIGLAAMAALAGPVGRLGGLIGSGASSLGLSGDRAEGAARKFGALTGAVIATGFAVKEVGSGLFFDLNPIDEAGGALRDFNANVETFATGIQSASQSGVSATTALRDAFREAAQANEALFVTTVEGAPVDVVVSDLKRWGLTVDELTGIITGGRDALDEWAAAQIAGGRATDSLNQPISVLGAAVDAYADGTKVAASRQDNLNTVLGETQTAAGDTATDIDRMTQAYSDLLGLLDQDNAFLNIEDGFDRVKEAAAEAYGAGIEGSEDAEQKQRDLQKATNDLLADVANLGVKYDDLPDEVVTEILASLALGDYETARRKLDELSEDRELTISVKMKMAASQGSYQDPRYANLPSDLNLPPGFGGSPIIVEDDGGRGNRARPGAMNVGQQVVAATSNAVAAGVALTGPTFEQILARVEEFQRTSASAQTATDRLGTSLEQLALKSRRARTPAAELAKAQRDAFDAAIGSARANAAQAEAQAKLDDRTFGAAESAAMQAEELSRLAAGLGQGSPLRTNLDAYIAALGRVKQGHEDNSAAEEEARKKSEEATRAAADRAQAMFDLAQANLDATRSQTRVTDATNEYVGALFMQTKTAEEAAQKADRIRSAEDALVDSIVAEARARAEQARLTAAAGGQTLSTADLAAIQAQQIGGAASMLQGGAPKSLLEQYAAQLAQVAGTTKLADTISMSFGNGSPAGVESAFSQLMWRMRLGG
jgi:hypothetical protein